MVQCKSRGPWKKSAESEMDCGDICTCGVGRRRRSRRRGDGAGAWATGSCGVGARGMLLLASRWRWPVVKNKGVEQGLSSKKNPPDFNPVSLITTVVVHKSEVTIGVVGQSEYNSTGYPRTAETVRAYLVFVETTPQRRALLVAHGLHKTVSSTSVCAAKARAAAVVVWGGVGRAAPPTVLVEVCA